MSASTTRAIKNRRSEYRRFLERGPLGKPLTRLASLRHPCLRVARSAPSPASCGRAPRESRQSFPMAAPARLTSGRFRTGSWLLVVLFLASHSCAPARHGVTLRFWAMGREGEVVQELVKDFEREHPEIHVEVQQIPWTAAHEKLLTSYVGHSTPDLAQLGNTWISEFVALKALAPLDPWVAHSPELKAEAFFPGIWATNLVNYEAYGIPW